MKGKRFARFVMIGTILMASSFLFAQGGTETSQGTMRLAWWGNPTRDERTIKAAQMYMEANPNVTIETETTGWSGYWDKMNTQAAAGSLPDVMQHDYAYMQQWVGRNQLKDLTPYIEDGVIDTSNIDQSFLEPGMVDGKLYGINLGTNAVCLTYDPAVLEAAGVEEPDSATWTWDDFEEMATTIFRKTGVQTIPFFTTDPKVGFDNMIRQMGLSTYAKDGKGLGFSDPSVLKEFYEIQLRLLDSGVMINPEIAYVNVTPAEGELAKGHSWLDFIWSNQFISTQEAANRPLKLALLPNLKDAKRPGTFLKASMFFSIPATAENPDEAARFIDYFVNDIGVNDVLLGERGVPIATDVREHLAAQVDENNRLIFNYIALASKHVSPIDPPDPAHSGEFLKMFRDTSLEILLEKTSVDDGVAYIMDQAKAILN